MWIHVALAMHALSSDDACRERIDRQNLGACALAASAAAKAGVAGVSAALGRIQAATPVLPANPQVDLSAAHRQGPTGQQAVNWYVTLRQELEIAGQRGARLAEADAHHQAAKEQLQAVARDVLAEAWLGFFDVVLQSALIGYTRTLGASAQGVAKSARAAADKGLIAEIEADVAEAQAIKTSHAGLRAERRLGEARARLIALLADTPADVIVSGELRPLPVPEEPGQDGAEQRSPELRAWRAERVRNQAHASLLRRARAPSLTLMGTAQSDGFNELVFGGGLSLTIPLPQPVGRTHQGDIAESEALAARADWAAEDTRRRYGGELRAARLAYASLGKEAQLFPSERLARAEAQLAALAAQVQSGRLAVRDALLSQQALIDLLLLSLEARHALCVSSVELLRLMNALPLRGDP